MREYNKAFVLIFIWAFIFVENVSIIHCASSSEKLIKGIRNNGGTCFANALAQCLFRIESVREFVLETSSGQSEMIGMKNLFTSLEDPLISSPVSGEKGQFIPVKFVRGEQGDSEEFYTAWLDILEKNDFKALLSELIIQVDLTRIRDEISDKLSDKWTSIRVTFPPVSSDGPIGIEELLSRSEGPFGEEQLSDSLRQFYRISRLPKFVLLTFVRGCYDSNFNPVKIETPVNLPETMDFSPFFSKEALERSAKTKYRLKMFVTHTGSNPQSGHYFAHARDSISKSDWSLFDDANVQRVTLEQALEAVKRASLVFYEQIID